MPIPNPKAYQTKDEFLQECMEVEVGSGKDQDQAFAICNSVWSESKMNRLKELKRLMRKP